jgi:hypothetical protein
MGRLRLNLNKYLKNFINRILHSITTLTLMVSVSNSISISFLITTESDKVKRSKVVPLLH